MNNNEPQPKCKWLKKMKLKQDSIQFKRKKRKNISCCSSSNYSTSNANCSDHHDTLNCNFDADDSMSTIVHKSHESTTTNDKSPVALLSHRLFERSHDISNDDINDNYWPTNHRARTTNMSQCKVQDARCCQKIIINTKININKGPLRAKRAIAPIDLMCLLVLIIPSITFIIITTQQTTCDTAGGIRRCRATAAQGQQMSNSEVEVDTSAMRQQQQEQLTNVVNWRQLQPGVESLLLEPQDTFALVNQSEVSLSCLIANKRSSLYWYRGETFWLAKEGHVYDHKDRYSVEVSNGYISGTSAGSGNGDLIYTNQVADNGDTINDFYNDNNNNNSTSTNTRIPFANYTLKIQNVKLIDDEEYFCKMLAKTAGIHSQQQQQPEVQRQHKHLISRAAKLTVLQAPSKIEIQAKQLADEHHYHLKSYDNNDPVIIPIVKSNTIVKHVQLQDASSSPEVSQQPIHRLVVIQDKRLRLECRANQAKPRAELTWFDAKNRRVPKLQSTSGFTSDDSLTTSVNATENDLETLQQQQDPDFVAEELVQIDPDSSRLELTTLIWSFKVTADHHNQVLTCHARHKAFDMMPSDTKLASLRQQSVQLDVQHEPVIELVKSVSHPEEFQPIKFFCQARARPDNDLIYAWYIDNQVIENATKPELFIARLTRQLHMREIKCQVTNAIGTSSAIIRLTVRYSPAYVSHLIDDQFAAATARNRHHAHSLALTRPQQQQQHRHSATLTTTSLPELAIKPISNQLAIGYIKGQNVTLNCDFDSHPRLASVKWFKVASDYQIMTNVTPQEADALIASGASHAAIFKRQAISLANNEQQQQHQLLHRRYIVPNDNNQAHSQQHPVELVYEQLDYAKISDELLDELAKLESVQQHQQPQQLSAQQTPLIEQLLSNKTTQRSLNVLEQVAWRMRSKTVAAAAAAVSGEPASFDAKLSSSNAKSSTNHRHIKTTNSSSSPTSSVNDNDNDQGQTELENDELDESDELVLIDYESDYNSAAVDHDDALSAAGFAPRLFERETLVTSSSISLARTNDESMGRYVCKAIALDGSQSVARAVYLVPMQRPRIVSVQQQFAPLGSPTIQVECLAQINTVNGSQINWYKNDQLIDVMLKVPDKPDKRFHIKEQRSPDLLYMRSILIVSKSDFSDFGRYNCSIINSYGSDSMQIDMEPSAPTGLTFKLLAYATVGSIMVFFAIVSLFVALAQPFRQPFGSVTKTVAMLPPEAGAKQQMHQANKNNKHHQADHQSGRSASTSSDDLDEHDASELDAHDPHSRMSADNLANGHRHHQRQLQGLCTSGSANPPLAGSYFSGLAPGSSDPTAATTTLMLMINDPSAGNRLIGSAPAVRRPGSAFEPSLAGWGATCNQHREYCTPLPALDSLTLGGGGGGNDANQLIGARPPVLPPPAPLTQHHRSFRSSLRPARPLPAAGGCRQASSSSHVINAGSMQSNKRFAAIHESLASKLQFGSATGSASPPNQLTPPLPSSGVGQQSAGEPAANEPSRPRNGLDSDDATASDYQMSSTKQQQHLQLEPSSQSQGQTQRTRLIDRIWARLQLNKGVVSTNNKPRRKQTRASVSIKGKQRPVISMPVELMNSNKQHSSSSTMGHGSTGSCRSTSSLSNSLAAINGAEAATMSATGSGATMRHRHQYQQRLGRHQVMMSSSSRANLIHDSSATCSTASGATTDTTPTNGHASQTTTTGCSSGRSSSCASSMAINHNSVTLIGNNSHSHPNSSLLHHQLHGQTHFTHMAPEDAAQALYANGTTNQQQPQQQQQVATFNCNADDPSQVHLYHHQHHAWAAMPTNNASSLETCAYNGHYQLPVLASEPYLESMVSAAGGSQFHNNNNLPADTTASQMHQQAVCYAGTCNGLIEGSGETMSDNNYNTLPATSCQQLQQQHHHHQAHESLVKTNDGGDAFFESNYGTLLASAYKSFNNNNTNPNSNYAIAVSSMQTIPDANDVTLNNTTLVANGTNIHLADQLQTVIHDNHSNISNSSSPNSLTTHANTSSHNNLSINRLINGPTSTTSSGSYLVYNPVANLSIGQTDSNEGQNTDEQQQHQQTNGFDNQTSYHQSNDKTSIYSMVEHHHSATKSGNDIDVGLATHV